MLSTWIYIKSLQLCIDDIDELPYGTHSFLEEEEEEDDDEEEKEVLPQLL